MTVLQPEHLTETSAAKHVFLNYLPHHKINNLVMPKIVNNLQPSASNPTPTSRTAKPNSEFYSIFLPKEVSEIIQALEVNREIPLKYAYKGKGAKNWDNFYQKYIVPKWYRKSSLEIDLLRDNFEYLNGTQKCEKVNIVDVGAGNSYPVKEFISKLNNLGIINQYIALDISAELLDLSQQNAHKWFPLLKYANHTIDIENACLPVCLLTNDDNIAKIVLHLGVTFANHQNRSKVLKNLRDSMVENDLLVFTVETGSNSQWDGKARGAYKYHVEQIYEWIKNKFGFKTEDCELVRKYDLETDSIVATLKLIHDYNLSFTLAGLDKNIQISAGEEITIWRHHKYQMPELIQELEQAGLQLVHYSTDKYQSLVMVICQVCNCIATRS